MSAEVTLTLTIDADGKVKFVEVTTNHPEIKSIEVLANYAVQNVQKWTFSKPASAPFRQSIIYDYKLDKNFPGPGFTVDFDLPDRVTISANLQPPPTQF
jgi:outer membrane biosynthesis protein TonB